MTKRLQSITSKLPAVVALCLLILLWQFLCQSGAVPDISLTTDIIVGFPGETEEDFQETLDVVEKSDFDTAFTFIYSKRSGTPAAKMEDQVPEDVVKDRFDQIGRAHV